jgi:TonB family protein
VSAGYNASGNPLPGAGLGKEPTANIGAMVSQELPYPGKRDLRASIASREADAAFQDIDAARLSIVARVKPNIYLTEEVPGNPSADVEVRCAPDGTIVGRRLVKSSGNKEWDDAVLRALDRTGVLPRDTDGTVPSSMLIGFRPRE